MIFLYITLNLYQKRNQDLYVGFEVHLTKDFNILRRKKKLFLNIFENKYRSTSSPKTHFYLVFPSKSEVKLFQAKRIKRLGSKCIGFAWGLCFLRGLEYSRRFSSNCSTCHLCSLMDLCPLLFSLRFSSVP